jgi:hypothetical protein
MRDAAPSPHAAATLASAASAAAPLANALAPAVPPALPAAEPPAAPAPQALFSETREPRETDVSAARVPPPAPASEEAPPASIAAAPASQLAPIAQATRAAAATGEEDQSFALVVLAAVLLFLAGPVLGITRLLSVLIIRAERRSALHAPTAPARADSKSFSAVMICETGLSIT